MPTINTCMSAAIVPTRPLQTHFQLLVPTRLKHTHLQQLIVPTRPLQIHLQEVGLLWPPLEGGFVMAWWEPTHLLKGSCGRFVCTTVPRHTHTHTHKLSLIWAECMGSLQGMRARLTCVYPVSMRPWRRGGIPAGSATSNR